MKQRLIDHRQQVTLAVMAVVILFLGTFRLLDVGQPIWYPDEYGYWANSSFFIGQNWSQTANSVWYYSYGYSILLIPSRLLAMLFHWTWRQLYESMIVVQSGMIVGSFLIAVRLSKRYMAELNWLVRDFACLAVFVYPTYIVYAHVTWTETTLLFTFWIFLYTMMRMTDKPSVKNHIGFALIAFYIFMVHQRCLGIVIAAVMIVVAMRLVKRNTLTQTACFLLVLLCSNCVHSIIKGKLQNDLYLAYTPASLREIAGYAWNKTTLLLLAASLFILLCLWLVERGKGIIAVVLVLAVVSAGVGFIFYNFSLIEQAAGSVDKRLAQNDFAGQLWKVKDVFSFPGFLRLLISIVGKWFYLASASGLIICFGMWELLKKFVVLTVKGIKCLFYIIIKKKDDYTLSESAGRAGTSIWLWGMFLSWLGVFSLSAIGMIGISRVDNLVYGRYHEFTMGILVLYGFYSLVKDKRWKRHLISFLVLYGLAAWLCQDLINDLKNRFYEVCHSIMMGRLMIDGQVPPAKLWEIAGCAALAGIIVCAAVKVQQSKFVKYERRRIVAILTAVICVYGGMGMYKTYDYVIRQNYTQEVSQPSIAAWVNMFYQGENIYFLKDTASYRDGLAMQYKLNDKLVSFRMLPDINPEEDAFYITGTEYGLSEEAQSKFGTIVETRKFTLLAPLNGNIYKRMVNYYNAY